VRGWILGNDPGRVHRKLGDEAGAAADPDGDLFDGSCEINTTIGPQPAGIWPMSTRRRNEGHRQQGHPLPFGR
jgi:hypothetical protein